MMLLHGFCFPLGMRRSLRPPSSNVAHVAPTHQLHIQLHMYLSTAGLDSATTYTVCKYLGDLARTMRCTTVVSLLQPSGGVLALFDDIMLLADGCANWHALELLLMGHNVALRFLNALRTCRHAVLLSAGACCTTVLWTPCCPGSPPWASPARPGRLSAWVGSAPASADCWSAPRRHCCVGHPHSSHHIATPCPASCSSPRSQEVPAFLQNLTSASGQRSLAAPALLAEAQKRQAASTQLVMSLEEMDAAFWGADKGPGADMRAALEAARAPEAYADLPRVRTGAWGV